MIDDRHDRRLALRAEGVLAEFNRADVLAAADVHVATRLGAMLGETDQQVMLAAALAVRAVRQGSVCVDLATVSEVPLEEDVESDVARAGRLGRPGRRPARWSASRC